MSNLGTIKSVTLTTGDTATLSIPLYTGTGTTGQAGSSSKAYIPSVWTFNIGYTPVAGDMIMIKIPAAGIASGVWISVDNGTTYYPIATVNKSRLTTQYPVDAMLMLMYEPNATTATYGTSTSGAPAGSATADLVSNRWTVVNGYDANNIIDDTAGIGDTDKTWSADKLSNETMFEKTLDQASIQSFDDGANWPMGMQIAIEPVQSGSGEPSPSNVRPITGWTGANVTVTGKNLLNQSGTNTGNGYVNGKYLGSSGELLTPTRVWCVTEYARVKPSTKYTLSGLRLANTAYFCEYDEARRFIISHSQSGTTLTFTTSASTAFLRVSRQPGNVNQGDTQLEEGNTATAYEPFGTVYPITFPNSAGTVYGGTLTVNADGTGTLVVDKGQIASYVGETLPGEWMSDRDVYVSGTTPSTGAQVVYDLATPITYTITPGQVLSLIGKNNVWADCGDILSLTYKGSKIMKLIREDTARQIAEANAVLKTMIAPELDGMVADTALAVNDFRIVDGVLYIVTAPIASGGTLTVGTNVSKTSIGEQITALLNAN